MDPIDGTRSFISGSPMYCTLIAFVRCGKPLIGLIDMPALDECWLGVNSADKSFSTFNGQPCRVAPCALLTQAKMATTTMGLIDDTRDQALRHLSQHTAHTRLGGDAQAYGSVASGFIHLAADYEMQPYDYLPLVAIVCAAGGQISDWHCHPLTPNLGKCGILASSNQSLHNAALTALST